MSFSLQRNFAMDRLTPQEARLIEALRRVPRASPARAAPARRLPPRRKRSRSPDIAQRWAQALEHALPRPQPAVLRAPVDDAAELFSQSSSSSPSRPQPGASSSSAIVAENPGDPQDDGGQQEAQQPRKRLRLLSAAEVRLRDENRAGSSPPEPVLRLVEPGERLTRTPVPSPATPYLQSWTRTLPDGRTLRVFNRVPRPPRYLTTEPRRPLP